MCELVNYTYFFFLMTGDKTGGTDSKGTLCWDKQLDIYIEGHEDTGNDGQVHGQDLLP